MIAIAMILMKFTTNLYLQDEDLVRALSDKSSEPPLVVNLSNETTPRGMTSIGMAMTQPIRSEAIQLSDNLHHDNVSENIAIMSLERDFQTWGQSQKTKMNKIKSDFSFQLLYYYALNVV